MPLRRDQEYTLLTKGVNEQNFKISNKIFFSEFLPEIRFGSVSNNLEQKISLTTLPLTGNTFFGIFVVLRSLTQSVCFDFRHERYFQTLKCVPREVPIQRDSYSMRFLFRFTLFKGGSNSKFKIFRMS